MFEGMMDVYVGVVESIEIYVEKGSTRGLRMPKSHTHTSGCGICWFPPFMRVSILRNRQPQQPVDEFAIHPSSKMCCLKCYKNMSLDKALADIGRTCVGPFFRIEFGLDKHQPHVHIDGYMFVSVF